MRTKWCIKSVRKLAIDRGYRLIQGEYKNQKSKLTFKCNLGHSYTTEARHFIHGCSCPICIGNRKESFSDITAAFTAEKYTLVSTERICLNFKFCPPL